LDHAREIVVVSRNALSLLSSHSAVLEPSPQPVNDNDLVPDSTRRQNGCHVRDGQGDPRNLRRNVGIDRSRLVWHENGFCAGLDLYGWTNGRVRLGGDNRVLKDEALAIGIFFIIYKMGKTVVDSGMVL
jgi:hypothetical protein